jgi:hypothetical protein
MGPARFVSVVLGSPEPRALGTFYEALLDFARFDDEPEWVRSGPRDGSRPGISFQLEESYVAPVWPPVDGEQQMMVHLDIAVADLDEEVARAVELGATLADFQPQDDVRVLFDPHGHAFCLFPMA